MSGAVTKSNLRDASRDCVLKGSHNIVSSSSPSTLLLTTGLTEASLALFDGDKHEWKQAIEPGDRENSRQFLKEANLSDSDNPLEALIYNSTCEGAELIPELTDDNSTDTTEARMPSTGARDSIVWLRVSDFVSPVCPRIRSSIG